MIGKKRTFEKVTKEIVTIKDDDKEDNNRNSGNTIKSLFA
jgi:hypothetical protein